MEKLTAIINTMLEKKNKPALSSLADEMNLRSDIGFDSLDLAELTVRIEREYGVDVFEDGLVTTVGEIVNKIGINGK
jgi:acyl carrier protein